MSVLPATGYSPLPLLSADRRGIQVCTEAGKTAEGTQGQKRLILEHAAEMYDQLRSGAGVTLVLEAGYASEPGGDIVVCKVGVGFSLRGKPRGD